MDKARYCGAQKRQIPPEEMACPVKTPSLSQASEVYGVLVSLIASDRAQRGAPRLCTSAILQKGVELLRASRSPWIVTGFAVPPLNVAETDGPPGAVALARALKKLGKHVVLATDPLCLPVVVGAARGLAYEGDIQGVQSAEEILFPSRGHKPDLLIYVERLGSAEDGHYYNMRGEDIGDYTLPLDKAALRALGSGIPCLAIGDGGNEAGMGLFRDELKVMLPDFASCLSVIPATVTLPVDVSNWGCYALAELLGPSSLGLSQGEEEAMLREMSAVGAVDGVTKRGGLTVDSFSLDVLNEVTRSIRCLFDKKNDEAP